MDAKKRMLQYLEYKGISQYDFSKKTGLSNGFLKSGNSISSENILLISNIYDINLVWLITGKGSMLKDIEIYNSGIDTISERLVYFQVKNGLTYYDTGSFLGLTQGEMRGLINRNEVTEEHINLIIEKFDISKKWFLTGEGEMPRIKNKQVRENIDNLVAKPTPSYVKEDDSKITILEKENELLKENNTSLKEINELLKKENMRLESENEKLRKN